MHNFNSISRISMHDNIEHESSFYTIWGAEIGKLTKMNLVNYQNSEEFYQEINLLKMPICKPRTLY